MQASWRPVAMRRWPSDRALRDSPRAPLPTKGTKRTLSNTFHRESEPTSDSHCLGRSPPRSQGQRQVHRMSVSPGLTCLLVPPENGRVSTGREGSLPVYTETSPTPQRQKGTDSARLPHPGSVPTCVGSWDRCRVGWHLRAIQGSSGTRVDPPAPRDLPALKPDSEINNVLKRASSEHL